VSATYWHQFINRPSPKTVADVAYLADDFDVQCFEISVVNSVSQFVSLKIYTVIY